MCVCVCVRLCMCVFGHSVFTIVVSLWPCMNCVSQCEQNVCRLSVSNRLLGASGLGKLKRSLWANLIMVRYDISPAYRVAVSLKR